MSQTCNVRIGSFERTRSSTRSRTDPGSRVQLGRRSNSRRVARRTADAAGGVYTGALVVDAEGYGPTRHPSRRPTTRPVSWRSTADVPNPSDKISMASCDGHMTTGGLKSHSICAMGSSPRVISPWSIAAACPATQNGRLSAPSSCLTVLLHKSVIRFDRCLVESRPCSIPRSATSPSPTTRASPSRPRSSSSRSSTTPACWRRKLNRRPSSARSLASGSNR